MTTAATNSDRPAPRGLGPTLVILAAWATLVTVLALDDFYVPAETGAPPLALLASLGGALLAFTLAWWRLPAFRRYVLALDLRLLVLIHSLRMLGLGFVMLYLVHHLPMSFAFLAGFGDALTAIGAVVLVWLMVSREGGVPRRWLWRWNTFGLLDFVVAISIGILTRQGAPLAPADGIGSDLMVHFPFVLIPGFLVQVYVLTHIVIYLQLRHRHAILTQTAEMRDLPATS